MKRSSILVTGGYGFIGSNLVAYLHNKYSSFKIVVLDKMDSDAANEINIPKDIRDDNDRFLLIKGDICNQEFINNAFLENNVKYVFHLAAQTHVDNSYKDPLECIMENIQGTYMIMNACRQHNVEKVLHMSTDEVYGDTGNNEAPATEKGTVLDPTNPYSASKAACEHIVKMMYHSWKLPMVIARSNNVYGPRQCLQKVVPLFIDKIKSSDNPSLELHDGGDQKRTWVFVEDVCEALDFIFKKGTLGEIYNIATEDELSVKEIALLIASLMNKQDSLHLTHIRKRPHNDQRYFINGDKLLKLGWIAKTKIKQGMQKTINWYL